MEDVETVVATPFCGAVALANSCRKGGVTERTDRCVAVKSPDGCAELCLSGEGAARTSVQRWVAGSKLWGAQSGRLSDLHLGRDRLGRLHRLLRLLGQGVYGLGRRL